MTVSVLYIAGVGRSGSTIFAEHLGALEGFLDLGELNHFVRYLAEDWPCECGERLTICPYWSQVGSLGFGGWGELNIASIRAAEQIVTRHRHVWRTPSGLGGSEFRRTLEEYRRFLERLYLAAADVGGARFIVDSSKSPAYGFVLCGAKSLRVQVVHLVRDSRGVAHSMRKHRRDSRTGRTLPRHGPTRAAVRWAVYNVCAWRLARSSRSSSCVRYEDYARAPSATLSSVLDALDPESCDGAAPPAKAGQVIHHRIAGNPARAGNESRAGETHLDDEWVSQSSERDFLVVSTITAPILKAFGYVLRRSKASSTGQRSH